MQSESLFLVFFGFFMCCAVLCEIEESNPLFLSFDHFKDQNNKSYNRPFEESRSRQAYEQNFLRIKAHNEKFANGNYSFQLRANSLADLSTEDYLKSYVRLVGSQRDPKADAKAELVGSSIHRLPPSIKIPESFDWRENGFETAARNQKSCGACYAFSVAESLEGQIFKRTGKIITLSEQQLVDCSSQTGNKGCAGGSLRNTLKYLEQTGGIMRYRDYPYRSKEGHCHYVPESAVVQVSSWAILPKNDEEAMRIAVATIGPIAVSINASPHTFQLYSKGVFDDSTCSSDIVNHAMLVVGYGPDYWILKNWWGHNWGENGYMKIRRGRNLCGLSSYAAYAVV